VCRRFSNSGETAMKNLIFLYRFEAKQKLKAHQEKNEAKKWVRFFACALEREQNGTDLTLKRKML
jgi:hypothetical protein